MRSFADEPAHAVSAVVLVLVLAGGIATAGQQQSTERLSDVDVARAMDVVKADPNLATQRTIKTLRWKASNVTLPDARVPSWLRWLVGLFRWIDQTARFLVWAAVAGLALTLVAYIVRLTRASGTRDPSTGFSAPTHVRDLDIRPESLPADIGGSARALWDRGDHRAALSLLYRGLLSRLVHVHRVPIRDSSTEGDCLSMAAGCLTPRKQDYTARLVGVWQRFVYGGESVEPATVYALCHDFASTLDHVSPSPV